MSRLDPAAPHTGQARKKEKPVRRNEPPTGPFRAIQADLAALRADFQATAGQLHGRLDVHAHALETVLRLAPPHGDRVPPGALTRAWGFLPSVQIVIDGGEWTVGLPAAAAPDELSSTWERVLDAARASEACRAAS